MLSSQDKADLDQAMVLINGVLDRHGIDLTMAVVSLLSQASNDVRIAEKYMAVDAMTQRMDRDDSGQVRHECAREVS